MKRVKIKDPNSPLFNICWNLYNQAFPEIERRPLDYHLEAMGKDAFNFEAILLNNSFIGFISWWEFDDVIYIEHFAVDNSLRGGGYGKKILNDFIQEYSKPIILEVEHPQDFMQQRRINFYEREGFILNPYNYSQPPYNGQDGRFLELLIITYPKAITRQELDNFIATKLPIIHFRYNFDNNYIFELRF